MDRQHWRTVRAIGGSFVIFVLTMLWPEHVLIWIPTGAFLVVLFA